MGYDVWVTRGTKSKITYVYTNRRSATRIAKRLSTISRGSEQYLVGRIAWVENWKHGKQLV